MSISDYLPQDDKRAASVGPRFTRTLHRVGGWVEGRPRHSTSEAGFFQLPKVMYEKHRRIDRCICLTSLCGGRTIDFLPKAVSFPAPARMHVVPDIPFYSLKICVWRR